jgi:hypothetical protein
MVNRKDFPVRSFFLQGAGNTAVHDGRIPASCHAPGTLIAQPGFGLS